MTTSTGLAGWNGKIRRAAGIIATGVGAGPTYTLTSAATAWDMDFLRQIDGAYMFTDEVGKRFVSSIVSAGGQTGPQYLKLIQDDPCGVFASGYDNPISVLIGEDDYVDIELAAGVHDVLISHYALGAGLYPNSGVSGIQVFESDEEVGGYMDLPGVNGFCNLADTEDLSIEKDIDVRAKIRADDYSIATQQCIAAHWQAYFTNKRAWRFYLDTAGKLGFVWSSNGTATVSTLSAAPGFKNGKDYWVRVTMDADNDASGHTIKFYRSQDTTLDHTEVRWQLISTTITAGVATMYNPDVDVTIGALVDLGVGPSYLAGRVYAAAILDGIGGTVVSEPYFNSGEIVDAYADSPWIPYGPGDQTFIPSTSEGIQVINAGHGGWQAATFMGSGLDSRVTDHVSKLDCPLVLIWFGYNEAANNVDPEDYRTYMTMFVEAVQNGNPDTRIMLVAGYQQVGTFTYPWSQYINVIYDLAAAYSGVEVIDFTINAWPQPGTAEGIASGYYSSGPHLTDAGEIAVANYILDFIKESSVSQRFGSIYESSGSGIDSYDGFFTRDQAVNGIEEETFAWAICDGIDVHGDTIVANGNFYCLDESQVPGMEYGWWTENISNGSGVFADPETLSVTFETRKANQIKVTTSYSLGRIATGTLYYRDSIGAWTSHAVNFAGGWEYTWDLGLHIDISGVRFKVLTTEHPLDVGRVHELIPLYVETFDADDIVSFDVDKIRESTDMTTPLGNTAANTLNINFDNTNKDWNPDGTGLWSDYIEPDIIIRPYLGWGIDDGTGPFTVNFSDYVDGPVPEAETGLRDVFLDLPDSQDEMGIRDGKLAVVEFRGPDQSFVSGGGRRGLLWRDTTTLTDNIVGIWDGSMAPTDTPSFNPTLHINTAGQWLGIAAWFIPPPWNWVELGVIGTNQEDFSYLDLVYGVPYPEPGDEVLLRSVGGYVSVEVNGVTILGPCEIPAELLGSSIHGVQMDVAVDSDEGRGIVDSVIIDANSKPLVQRPFPPVQTPIGTAVETASSSTINVPYPTGITAGDHLYAIVGFKNGGTISASGWDEISAGFLQAGAQGVRVLHKEATGTETGNLTVTKSSAGVMAGVMIRMKDVHVAALSGTTSTTGTSMPSPATKIFGPNRTGLWIGLTAIDTTITTPSSWTLISNGIIGGEDIRLTVAAYGGLENHPDGPTSPFNAYDATNFPAQVGTAGSSCANAAGILFFVPALGEVAPEVGTELATIAPGEYIPMGEYYVDSIEVSEGMTAAVSCRDYSKYMQEMNVEEGIFHTDETVGSAISDAAKLAGVPNRKINYTDAYWRTMIRQNPVSVWTLADSPAITEGDLYDSDIILDIAGGNDGVVNYTDVDDVQLGEPSIIPSKKTHCVRFTGTASSNITVPENTVLDFASALSIVIMIKPEAWTNSILEKGNNYLVELESDGTLSFTVDSVVYNNGPALTLNESHFVAAAFDGPGGTAVFNIDGVEYSEAIVDPTFTTNNSDLIIGSDAAGNEYSGWLQGVALWDRALTSDEMNQLYIEANIEEIFYFPYLYMIESSLWDGMLEWATADIGIFYFDEYGNFNYDYRNTLHDEVFPSHALVQHTFNENVDIIGGQRMAEIQTNRVVITVNPITTINSDVQSIWRAENGESLVVTKTRETIDATRTDFLKVKSTDHPLWLNSGYFKIDDEIIKYDSKSGNKLMGLTRGQFGTIPATHGTKTYGFESTGERFIAIENCRVKRSETQARLGAGSLKVTCDLDEGAGSTAEINGPKGRQAAIPTTFGSTTVSFWIYSQTAAKTVTPGVRFFNDVDDDTIKLLGTSSTSTLGAWKQYSYTFTPDTNKKYMTPVISIASVATGDVFYIDHVEVTNTRPRVREVRYYDIDYDSAPAIRVKEPFITAVIYDGTVTIESFDADAFSARVLLSAKDNVPVDTIIVLEGTDPVTELENYFSIAGIPLVEEVENDVVEEVSEELNNMIRKHHVQELTIENKFIQNKEYAQVVADWLIAHFSNPVPVMNLSTTGVPMIQLGDRIGITGFDQLDINGVEFWVLQTTIAYDGGIQQSFTLREVS